MSAAQKPQEYAVKVPRIEDQKRFSVLKFNGPLNIDPVQWKEMKLKMSRENNKTQTVGQDIKQEFGEGSEYGKAAREEARRKKYGRQRKTFNLDDQPWRLALEDAEGKERKFRSIREAGAGEHADYWVFLKAPDGGFHAHKVDDWYQFLPSVTHKVLDADQAEERFQQRNKVLNQFALKASIQQQLKDQDEEGGVTMKASSLKIKDEMSSDEDEDTRDDEGGEEKRKQKKAKKGQDDAERKRKEKKQRVESADQVAAYESDDGDDEGREFDYMSDSGSDTDREEKPAEQKVEEALVSVGDEEGLKKTIEHDELESSDEEEDEEEKTKEKDLAEKVRAQAEGREDEVEEKFKKIEARDSSDDESDDPDSGNLKSVLFMEKKEAAQKRPAPADEDPSAAEPDTKKAKVDEEKFEMPAAPLAAHAAIEAFDEDAVRRLLQRKPHTTKELLGKMKTRCGSMSKQEIVSKLAQILKKIEPEQYRQKVGDKDVLYFTLKS